MTTFFDRYAAQMEKLGIDPCSQKASEMFGVTKAALSTWNIKKTTPKGDTVARMADALGISADYLLGRTTDPTDFTKAKTPEPATLTWEEFAKGRKEPGIMKLYRKLDDADKIKAEGVIQGMLMQDKYIDQLNAAHDRTDTDVTEDMVSNDESIMNSPEF